MEHERQRTLHCTLFEDQMHALEQQQAVPGWPVLLAGSKKAWDI